MTAAHNLTGVQAEATTQQCQADLFYTSSLSKFHFDQLVELFFLGIQGSLGRKLLFKIHLILSSIRFVPPMHMRSRGHARPALTLFLECTLELAN